MDGMDPITNDEDIIDSRDVIARIEYLESLADLDGENTLDEDEREELTKLQALTQEGEGYSDWPYGATLVRDSYFEEYAKQLAEDVGAVSADAAWPACHIDWEAAADSLRMDYTEIDFDGVAYLVR